MAGGIVKRFLQISVGILYKVKERLLSKRSLLDWECISVLLARTRLIHWECITKPLKGQPGDFVNIHTPTIEDYRMTYRLDGKVKIIYDWWYSAILKDLNGNIYFPILVFNPRWSYCRIIRIDTNNTAKKLWSLPKFLVARHDFEVKIGYSKQKNAIDIWVPITNKPESSENSYLKSTIEAGKSRLSLKTNNTALELTFTSLGLPFWINRGREATISPRGDTMSGFYDVCQVEGSIIRGSVKTKISGVGINEHLMSFTPPIRFWKRVDVVFFCSDEVYCTFWYLENRVGAQQYEYKDGAVFLRATNEYLIPIDFKIEYLEFDVLKKAPIRIRVSVETTEGELDVVAEAIVEDEGQLALKIVNGQFIFRDGRRLRLTNGFGHHALH
jgi:hypothetical protein